MFNKKSTDMFKPNLNIFLQYFLQAGDRNFMNLLVIINFISFAIIISFLINPLDYLPRTHECIIWTTAFEKKYLRECLYSLTE